MNSKQAKKIRKAMRAMQPDVVKMMDGLKAWPFKMRLQLAWALIKGKKKESPHTDNKVK